MKRTGTSVKVDGFADDDLVPLLRDISDQARLLEEAQGGILLKISNDYGYV